MRRVFLGALLALMLAPASAEIQLVIGKVKRIEVLGKGQPRCPASPHGVVDNACGCQEIDLHAESTLLGPGVQADLRFQQALGEWCLPSADVGKSLFYLVDGHLSRSYDLSNDEGTIWVDGKQFRAIAGIPFKVLHPNDNGWVKLDEVLARLKETQRK